MNDKRILLGEITGAHGIRGDLFVRSYTDHPQAIGDYGALTDENGVAPLTLKVVRTTPKGAIVARVKGVVDRNGAQALKGRKLCVARAAMPEPDEEEDFYYADLIGLAVIDERANALGEIVAVHNYGAGDLLEIRLATTKKSELVPFTKACVPKIDFSARRATVVLPELVEGEKPEEEPRDRNAGA